MPIMAQDHPERAGFAALPAPLRGALWMVSASAMFAGMIGIIRFLAVRDELHPFEIVFFRNLFGLAFMLPWLARAGFAGLRTRRIGLYTLRGVISLMAMLSWFWAVSVMPLAEAVALSFTTPIFATVLAVVVLHEVVRARRWTATLTGFLGAMIILRPGLHPLAPAALVVLFSAVAIAGAITCLKQLARTESANAIVTYMVLFLTPMSLIPALFVWTTPSWDSLFWLVALGGLATAAHGCVTRGFAAADASAIMPLDFVRLPFAALIGFVVFDEVPDIWTWIGAAVIFGASAYIAHRETRLAGRLRPAAESGRYPPGS